MTKKTKVAIIGHGKPETPPTQKQIEEWRIRAEKWDALADEIGKFYSEDGEPAPENGGDLCDIGEAAAMAFGYL